MKRHVRSASKGDLVQIHKVILTPEQRAENIPTSTKAVSYEAWIKGFLLDDKASIGDAVKVETFIGRQLSGSLAEVNPMYTHNFGKPQLTLLCGGMEAKKRMARRSKAS